MVITSWYLFHVSSFFLFPNIATVTSWVTPMFPKNSIPSRTAFSLYCFKSHNRVRGNRFSPPFNCFWQMRGAVVLLRKPHYSHCLLACMTSYFWTYLFCIFYIQVSTLKMIEIWGENLETPLLFSGYLVFI